jgi:hypothetical protein
MIVLIFCIKISVGNSIDKINNIGLPQSSSTEMATQVIEWYFNGIICDDLTPAPDTN